MTIGKHIRAALAFFPSVIKCGESWTPTCEKAKRDADKELADLLIDHQRTLNELFDLRCKAGCGPDQAGPDVWDQLAQAKAEITRLQA